MNNLASRIERLEVKRPAVERVVITTTVLENDFVGIAAADKKVAEAQAAAEAQGKQLVHIRTIIVEWPKVDQG